MVQRTYSEHLPPRLSKPITLFMSVPSVYITYFYLKCPSQVRFSISEGDCILHLCQLISLIETTRGFHPGVVMSEYCAIDGKLRN